MITEKQNTGLIYGKLGGLVYFGKESFGVRVLRISNRSFDN
jgi:uncharacterized protein (UPF0548 family)